MRATIEHGSKQIFLAAEIIVNAPEVGAGFGIGALGGLILNTR
jgi:hypothetical protein